MSRTIGIVTVFHPSIKHIDNIKLISEQVDLLIISDNSPTKNSELFKLFKNVVYRFWNRNLGLSSSFNRILTDESFGWKDSDNIIFFDQDSIIPTGHIRSLIIDYEYLENKGLSVGCIGPVFINQSIGTTEIPTLNEKIDKNILKVKGIITSSMLCKYENLRLISFWNEKLFLDMADWDLCWRLIEKQKYCYMSSNSIMKHSVGEGKKSILFFNLRIGKPFREYYQTRDCMYLMGERYLPWNFRLRFIIRILFRPIVHIVFLDNSFKRAKYIFLGIKDFFLKKRGEIDKSYL